MQQVNLDLLRRFDPLALSPLVEDQEYGYFFLKRAMDVFLATFFLVILSPLMVLIAILIFLDSSGSIIFSQERVGTNRWTRAGFSYWQRTRFTCYKFRTMMEDADPSLHRAYVRALIRNDKQRMSELQGVKTDMRKLVKDPRVTRVGKLLRKSSFDELPQLWNVIKGDMSLVGPRPPLPYEVDRYEPWHLRRLETYPGLTGLWQVNARSSMDFDDSVRLDIYYVDNQSLWLDLKIIAKTPLAILSAHGAV